MAGGANPCCTMHIQAHVIAVLQLGLSGVHPHSYTHLAVPRPASGRERPLSVHRGPDRVTRAIEHDDEAVAFGRKLVAMVAPKRRPEQTAMLCEDLRVAAPQLPEKPRRALDVAEQKGDHAGRQLVHTAQLHPRWRRLSSADGARGCGHLRAPGGMHL